MAKGSVDTPLMQQHHAIKQRYPDAVLLFRVGDFYETFGQDAVIAAQVLGITLTKRNNGAAASSELAGFPHHALETYLHKLVKAGYRVAICDQLEDPKQAKGIVKRGVTELVTPGVATNDKLLEHNSNNFLAAMHFSEDGCGIAFLDISTGEFFVAEGNAEYADRLLQSLKPAEVVFQKNRQKWFKEQYGTRFHTYGLDEWIFQQSYAEETLLRHFQTHSLKGFGLNTGSLALIAAGAVLHYLKDTEHPNLQHITTIQTIQRQEHLWMDRFTIKNLELLPQLGQPGEQTTSLLQVVDKTLTPMGGRMLKKWMLLPLQNAVSIQERLEAVEWLLLHADTHQSLQQFLDRCGDLERLVSKVPLKKINPREVKQVALALEIARQCREAIRGTNNGLLEQIGEAIEPCTPLVEKIVQTLQENPPAALSKGEVIAAGVNVELDELRALAHSGKDYLNAMQQREIEQTGIGTLKIGFNNVFGYYLEVTNAHKDKVPAEWIRKQTLTNAERYITPELKSYEEKILGAEERIQKLESDLFEALLVSLQNELRPIQKNAFLLAQLDCLCSFAQTAQQNNYSKPQIHEGLHLQIKNARHPVIEKTLPPGESYIANDIWLDPVEQQIVILTGPNMSGKSAILRQTALITLLAHMGSFVPASSAEIPLTDKIFTRVGASDNLSGGESTFMVEMNETASIINNVSERSLILLDEIGRGTSTYDGISIAWSIVEFLHHQTPYKPKTLFATHYHELNDLEAQLSGVKNFHVTHKESGNKIIFLRKLAPGGSTHSFGIHVARMAGMPAPLVHRATEVLKELEQKHGANPNQEALQKVSAPKMQLSIFDAHSETFDQIRQKLNHIDINRLTPVEALLKLQEIKDMVKS